MDNSWRNEELLSRMEVNDFTIDKDSHCSALDPETLGKSRVYVRRRTWRMRVKGELRPDQTRLAPDDSLREPFGFAVEDLADLWNELQSRLGLREHNAIQQRPDRNEEGRSRSSNPITSTANSLLRTIHAA